jgi:hypothetical protein
MSIGVGILSSITRIYGGIQAQKAAASEASDIRQQGYIQAQESFRDAKVVEEEAESFRKRQKVMFLKSGVALEGTPLLVLEDTRLKAQEEAEAIRRRGIAEFNLADKKAKRVFRQGRAALIEANVKGLTSAFLLSTTKKKSTRRK